MSFRTDLERALRRASAAVRRGWHAAGRRRLTVLDRTGRQRLTLPLTVVVVLGIIALLRPGLLLLLALALVAPLLFGFELRLERHDPPETDDGR